MSIVHDAILFELVQPHTALVTINRPDARNAVNGDVATGIDAALKRIEADPDIWVAIITGAGGNAFCAGADLKALASGEGARLATRDGGFAGFTSAPRTKLWIAAVEGFALAGGCEIALACDLIVASREASFGLPEVRRGLIAAAGGVYRLPRCLPSKLALELIATGGTISAAQAHHHGMINRLADKGGALAEALSLAAAINDNAPLAVRESLAIARQAVAQDEAAMQQLSDVAIARVTQSDDFQEGVQAFVEKRAPRWTGR
ncbi:crotonase/enoyl-CoA hydratase family protein [Aquisediminimonas sediminicola]|uniref:crotonase/enoyl-CoA hydratase family protein n=1 Tax=Alteraquisediminimonas sediminicola TaxID=2676787 RepID=UPI001C8EA055|nr:crotonase/enoyl-CoA hydratase family protein [Aquisediminimonas sediminicola]